MCSFWTPITPRIPRKTDTDKNQRKRTETNGKPTETTVFGSRWGEPKGGPVTVSRSHSLVTPTGGVGGFVCIFGCQINSVVAFCGFWWSNKFRQECLSSPGVK